ncbi:uncharacterized protein LOC130494480 isoform X2 [Raphanus sativus]|uniref:Uncharacterized protein LOC130494480 isoform X2 n=1 Tax=Raphanus sativus TaxID=3726 RepID=A0A9W3CC85_RAPSA|nr:uncharacterized protein LOC130494480 isoform X2 [Raphanus sativus]
MDLDFDDEPAAPTARAGARFKPKGRPQPKKKQVSVSTSQQTTTLSSDAAAKETVLSTQSKDSSSSTYPTNVSTSETIVVPDGRGTISQSTMGTISKEVNSEGKRCEDGTEAAAPACPDDPRRQDSATFRDFVTHETDELINAETQRMQTGEEGEECHWNMETLDIVQEEGMTSAYEQHTGKFQPKPRLLDTVIEEEPESHYSVDDTMDAANQSEFMVNEESRNGEFNTDSTSHGDHQEEHNIPEVPRETAPGVLEQEHHVVPPTSNNDTVMGEGEPQSNEAEPCTTDKKGKKKRVRKKKTTTSEEEPEKKKKFKHSSRRQKNRTLEKELLETPDDQIPKLPIKDMIRLVQYREKLEKKEAKGAPVVPPTQESNTQASEFNNYYSQGFDAEVEDEFGMEEGENQETYVVKPDSPVNYHSYMNKTPRTRWSKQDTQLFYEGIQQFGSNLLMVQRLFRSPERPKRTHHQIKLKFKLEERKNPLKLDDALSTRSKDLSLYHNVLKDLEEEAAAKKEGEEEEEEEGEGEEAGEEAETTTDGPENEEPTKTEETERAGDGVTGVKESDGGDECDDNEGDDDDFWNSYKSEM